MDAQVSCINKTDRMNPHERIRRVGGMNGDGTRWSMDLDVAIRWIKEGNRLWVQVAGKRVWVIIARSAQGHEYLKTEADGEQPNNLLSLPECPA
jgi:hypothetical protein